MRPSPTITMALAASASALTLHPRVPQAQMRHAAVAMSAFENAPPPAGFEWATFDDVAVATATAEPAAPAATAVAEPAATATVTAAPDPTDAVPALTGKVVPAGKGKGKGKPAPTGPFAPLVLGAKNVMGTKELNALRADIIAKHTKVISAFVDTSESPFGQLALKRMFEAADKDGNGTLDREEIREALQALGFSFVQDKQLDQMMSRGDVNDDDVIDFEEFVKEAPKSLRTNLVKLAKQNGHDLGFLA